MSAPVYDCVEPVEIVALTDGDIEVERIEELLDHVDGCRYCSTMLQTLVVLKANREEALEILRRAETWKEREKCSDR